MNLNAILKDQDLTQLKFFEDLLHDRLKILHCELSEVFKNISYSRTLASKPAHEMIIDLMAGCTEQCPFCGAQCDRSTNNHLSINGSDGKVLHITRHRPEGLGSYRWENKNTFVLDNCTYLVASDTVFRNKDTGGKWHPYRQYSEIYAEWDIAPDSSSNVSMYWKWFIAHYQTEIEEFFGYAKSEIPQEWKHFQWWEVEEWLKREYRLK